MFRRARWRLTLLYIALFAVALGIFAAVFYIGFATVLAPAFDLAPELTNVQAADAAYRATIERKGERATHPEGAAPSSRPPKD